MVDYLKSTEGREALKRIGYDKIKLLFPKDPFLVNSNFVDRAIVNFDNQTLFKQIFIY